MDVFKFINSRDIAAYLKEIDYDFSPLEISYLVYQSKNTTLEEKFSAWQEVIDTMPDSVIEERRWFKRSNLHDFLRKHILLEKRLLQEFYRDEENALYTFSLHCKGDQSWSGNFENIFPDLPSCLKYLDEEWLSGKDYEIDDLQLKKLNLSQPDCYILLLCDREVRPKEIIFNCDIGLNQREKDILFGFEGLWFSFPTPFKKGDILHTPYDWDDFIFVLDDMCTWGKKELIENAVSERRCSYDSIEELVARHIKDGDESDMIAAGYYMEGNTVFHDHTSGSYLDLEYYRAELTGKNRVLTALSNYLKDKIDIGLLMYSYYRILTEEGEKESRKWLECFFEKDLPLAGLKRSEK